MGGGLPSFGTSPSLPPVFPSLPPVSPPSSHPPVFPSLPSSGVFPSQNRWYTRYRRPRQPRFRARASLEKKRSCGTCILGRSGKEVLAFIHTMSYPILALLFWHPTAHSTSTCYWERGGGGAGGTPRRSDPSTSARRATLSKPN